MSSSWLDHAARLLRGDDRAASRSGRTASWSRSPATTAICCEFRRRRHPLPGHRAGGERRRGRPRRRRADRGALLRPRDGARHPGRARRPRPSWWSPTTCWRMSPTSTISSAGWRCWRPAGVVSIEAPHLVAWSTACSSTRSTTSTTPTGRCLRWSGVLARQGLRVFDVERAGDAWRLAARLRPPRANARRPRPAGAAGEEAARGVGDDAGYRGFGPRVRAVLDGLRAWLARPPPRAAASAPMAPRPRATRC